MSSVEQYAASTVEKYHVAADNESTSHRAAAEVIPLIKQWGKQYLQDIKLSGAYAKKHGGLSLLRRRRADYAQSRDRQRH